MQAFHRSKNPASGRVLQKAGMKFEGNLKQYLIIKENLMIALFMQLYGINY